MNNISFSVVIAAAGSGTRLGDSTPKQWLDLAGEPMVVRAIRRFEGVAGLSKLVVALSPDEYDARKAQLKEFEFDLDMIFCRGGKARQDSVKNAIEKLSPDDNEIIVVHDAARPFVSQDLILRVVERAKAEQAAIAAIPVNDTIKEVDRLGFVSHTPKRSFLRRAQTPQAVKAGILKKGMALATERGLEFTDDALAAEIMGHRVAVVNGEEKNFKITTSFDLEIARMQIARGDLKL